MTNPISDEALAAIKAGLGGVTPGPWRVGSSGPNTDAIIDSDKRYIAECTARHCNWRYEALIEHIARLDPKTVASLIERLERAEGRVTALEARRERLERALTWYGENARLARLIHSEGDLGRKNLAEDGGKRARAALEGK
jgi:hypothetical protein